jgi:hypothetical protein
MGQPAPCGPARPSTDEKAELWPQIVAAYKNYARYEERSGRDIPVVICEPRPS